MKRSNHLLTGGLLLSAALFLFSCSKQITEPQAPEATVALNEAATATMMAPTDCKPALLAEMMSNTIPPWATVAQKWYAGGKVNYIKLSGLTRRVSATFEPAPHIDWGEVTYQGDQVYLRDVIKNRQVFRVTMGANGLPAASYLDNQTNDVQIYSKDTTYYYYTGNRLDSFLTLTEVRIGGNPLFKATKHKLKYDMYGNIKEVDIPVLSSGTSQGTKLIFDYDYTMPVAGIINNYRINASQKLLEFLELYTLPMHHALKRVTFGTYIGPPAPFEVFNPINWEDYTNYVLMDGRVHSYMLISPGSTSTFYNGWECNAGARLQTVAPGKRDAVSSLDEFLLRYSK